MSTMVPPVYSLSSLKCYILGKAPAPYPPLPSSPVYFSRSMNAEGYFSEERSVIQDVLFKRKIRYLVHFTHKKNLESILRLGLAGRHFLRGNNIDFSYNDQYRLDSVKNGICCSVSFPNYKMLWKLRRESIEDWVVIRINPDVLFHKKCSFFRYNAASNLAKRQTDCSYRSFESLFGDLPEKDIKRASLDIPSWYTTDPQAEIIFHDPIEPSFFFDVCFLNNNDMLFWHEGEPDRLYEYGPDYQYAEDNLFMPRRDHDREEPESDEFELLHSWI